MLESRKQDRDFELICFYNLCDVDGKSVEGVTQALRQFAEAATRYIEIPDLLKSVRMDKREFIFSEEPYCTKPLLATGSARA